MEVNPQAIARDFKRGLTRLGLARKYGLTVKEVEDAIRKALREQ